MLVFTWEPALKFFDTRLIHASERLVSLAQASVVNNNLLLFERSRRAEEALWKVAGTLLKQGKDCCRLESTVLQPRFNSQPLTKLEVTSMTTSPQKKIVAGTVGSGRFIFRVGFRHVYDPVQQQMTEEWTPVYKLKHMVMELGHKSAPYWSTAAAKADGLSTDTKTAFATDVLCTQLQQDSFKDHQADVSWSEVKSILGDSAAKYESVYKMKLKDNNTTTSQEKELLASFVNRVSSKARKDGPDD
eukprot:50680-Amphidinium_carterae.1